MTWAIAARASASTVVPPAGAAGTVAARHCPAMWQRSCPVARSSTRMPSRGPANSQLPPCRQAMAPALPLQAPAGVLPTSQHSPSTGAVGGVFATPSMAVWSSASASAWASLTKNSFCACAASVAVLRAAQAFRLGGRIERGLRAARPGQPAQRRLEHRPPVGRADGEDAAFALDHHRARLGQRRADQGDAGRGVLLGHLAHPFGPGAGLAEAASGEHQPEPPFALGRQLLAARPQAPVGRQLLALGLGEAGEAGEAFLVLQLEQFPEQAAVSAVGLHSASASAASAASAAVSRRRMRPSFWLIETMIAAASSLLRIARWRAALSRWAASRRKAVALS